MNHICMQSFRNCISYLLLDLIPSNLILWQLPFRKVFAILNVLFIWANVKDENGNPVFSIEDGITKMRFEDPNDSSRYYDAVIDKDGNPISMVDWKGNIVEWKDGVIYKNGELIKEQKIEEIIDADGNGHISINSITNWGDTPMLDFHGVK